MLPNPERAFLQAIFDNPANGFQANDSSGLRSEDFIGLETRVFHQELLRMRDEGKPIGQAELADRVPDKYRVAVWELSSETIAPQADYWASILVKLAKRRRLITLAENLKLSAGDPDSDIEQAIDSALLTLSESQSKGLVNKSITLKEAYAELIADLRNPPRFIPTPWPALNDFIGGLRPGAFYVIAARPGVGKSLIGLQLAQGIATLEKPVALFSFEMISEEIVTRAASSIAGVDLTAIDRRTLSEGQIERIKKGYEKVSSNLHIHGSESKEVTQLRPAIRALKANQGGKLGAVVIDYLGLLNAKGATLYEQVTAISGQLKSLAMELDIPIIALAQLNRKAEERDGGGSLADLRDSGAIEQDADVVIVLSVKESSEDYLRVNILKNRQGPQGALQGRLNRATMTLSDLVKV